jgi:membrane protein DedA with SNARE-associated domain
VRRPGATITVLIAPALLHIHIHIHLHHRFHGPPFDYLGLAVGAAVSWIGLPGPGEPLLFAAAILAARHELDLATVIVVAWLAATGGGIVGWAIGRKAGRALVTVPGPLRTARIRAVQRGEELFERHPVVAILLTPAFVAGIHRVPSRVYQPINAVTAAIWAVGIGAGGYYLGPPVLDIFSDFGVGFTVIVIAAVIALVVAGVVRRRRAPRPGA